MNRRSFLKVLGTVSLLRSVVPSRSPAPCTHPSRPGSYREWFFKQTTDVRNAIGGPKCVCCGGPRPFANKRTQLCTDCRPPTVHVRTLKTPDARAFRRKNKFSNAGFHRGWVPLPPTYTKECGWKFDG